MKTTLSNQASSYNEVALNKKKSIDMKNFMMVFALLGIWLIFSLLTSGTFITPRNISNLVRQMTFTVILAIGMMNVILLGEIDLSVGSLVGLCGGMFAIMSTQLNVPLLPALLLTLLLGFGLGIWNGFWTAYQKVPSFIVTLAGQLIFRGALVGLTGGKTIAPLDPNLQWLGGEYISNTVGYILGILVIGLLLFLQWSARSKRAKMQLELKPVRNELIRSIVTVVLIVGFVIMMNAYKGIPRAVYLIALLFGVFYFMTQKTVFGRRLYAIGGNKPASILAGINVKKNIMMVLGLNGLISSIAAIFLCARLDSAAVAAGTNGELDAIASCVIGGASLLGGVGSLPGVVIGAAVMASIDNGMALLDTPAFWQTIIKGLVLLLAVWFDMSRKKKN